MYAFLFSCICMRVWCMHTCVQCRCVTCVRIFWKPEKDVKWPALFFSLPCFFESGSLIDSGGGLVASKLQQSSCRRSTHWAGVTGMHIAIMHWDPSSGPHAVQQALLPTHSSFQTLIVMLSLIGWVTTIQSILTIQWLCEYLHITQKGACYHERDNHTVTT